MRIGFFGKVTPEQIEEFKSIWPNYTIEESEIQPDLQSFRTLGSFERAEEEEFIVWSPVPLESLVNWAWKNYSEDPLYPDDLITDGKFAWRNIVSYFDVIFFFPQEELTNLDAIRRAMVKSYESQEDSFFPLQDCPAVIPIAGPMDLRIKQLQLYLKVDGTSYVEEDGSLVDFNELAEMENEN
jgi:hypothetical protein